MPVHLDQIDGVSILHLGDDENRFTLEWLDQVEAAIAQVADAAPGALVTVGDGRFYSNGLHLETLLDPEIGGTTYANRVEKLFATVMALPVLTVAAVNGHAFGAGAMLAIAHDFRLMNTEKGFFCFPEIDIKIPFSTGMAALIQAKTTPATTNEAMTTGRRYNGPDAVDRGLVDTAVAPNDLIDAAKAIAAPLADKDPATLAAIKETMYATPLTALRE